MRSAGLNKPQLAERLGWQRSQVTRLFGVMPRISTRSRRPYTGSGGA
jgi:hypothetical protein